MKSRDSENRCNSRKQTLEMKSELKVTREQVNTIDCSWRKIGSRKNFFQKKVATRIRRKMEKLEVGLR
jgi:ribosome biogenesis protein Tsr3